MSASSRKGRRNPEETRRRIVEAVVALHEEVGPAATTVTAIAERAGVERLTVYRHLPDERAQIQACSAHWSEDHPLPDDGLWAGIPDPVQRLRTALEKIYEYFRRGGPMLRNVLRDEDEVPALGEIMGPFHGWLRELAGQLSAGWGVEPGSQRVLRAFVGHALRFETWQSLAEEGLQDREAAHLLTRMCRCLATEPWPPT